MASEIDSFLNSHHYPLEYRKVIEMNLLNLNPWEILYDNRLLLKFEGITKRYSGQSLLPFAVRVDCDDVACWDEKNKRVIILHDFASSGWEHRDEFDTFWGWFRSAVEDMIEFTNDDIEYERKENK